MAYERARLSWNQAVASAAVPGNSIHPGARRHEGVTRDPVVMTARSSPGL
jgi:hypothetical protein